MAIIESTTRWEKYEDLVTSTANVCHHIGMTNELNFVFIRRLVGLAFQYGRHDMIEELATNRAPYPGERRKSLILPEKK